MHASGVFTLPYEQRMGAMNGHLNYDEDTRKRISSRIWEQNTAFEELGEDVFSHSLGSVPTS